MCLLSQAWTVVNFKDQSIKNTLPEAKEKQKLIMSVCSSESCSPCRWMKEHVYTDEQLSKMINEKLIPIDTVTNLDRMEIMKYCGTLPSILFFNENGDLIHKETGKKTLGEMSSIVTKVLAYNCTEEDQKLELSLGTSKASNCCDGLVADREQKCVKRQCVENSERGIYFEGDPRQALDCCEDGAEKRVIVTIKGYVIHCMNQEEFKQVNDRRRGELKEGELDIIDSKIAPAIEVYPQ